MTARNPDRLCMFDSEIDTKGLVARSCYRLAVPGRLVCHKHAGTINKGKKRRAKNKVARASRKANR